MKVSVFNACLIAAWLLASAGGIILNLGAGLAASGVLLAALTVVVAARFGVYEEKAPAAARADA